MNEEEKDGIPPIVKVFTTSALLFSGWALTEYVSGNKFTATAMTLGLAWGLQQYGKQLRPTATELRGRFFGDDSKLKYVDDTLNAGHVVVQGAINKVTSLCSGLKSAK